MIKKENIIKDRRLVKNRQNINKLKTIVKVEELIDIKVDLLYKEISHKYAIDEDEIYEVLYLKVRKMFLEEDD